VKKIPLIAIISVGLVAALFTGFSLTSGSSEPASPLGAAGVLASNFKDGALAQDITEEACTLTDGTETTCYRIIVTGTPVDTQIGPFCPTTTGSTAEESGIWLDGSKVYDADGAFILDLSNIYGDAKWKLYDDSGKVNVTDTKEAFEGAARPDVQEEYKYHCVEGKYDWTSTGEAVPISMLVPVNPVKATSTTTSQGADLGVTLNGLVIAPSAPVDAILGAYTIAAFDDCGGHFNPFEGYHMHAYTNCEGATYGAAISDPDAETNLVGYALDGVAVFAPLAANTTIELDECNGRSTEADGYHYYAQTAEKNRVIKCFTGLTAVDSSKSASPGPMGAPGVGALGVNPWVIGGAVAGISVLAVAAAAIFRRRRKKTSSISAKYIESE